MDYRDTVDFLYAQLPMYQNKGGSALKKGLDGIKKLLNALDNPEEALKMIHIGGTNGKGSTCHILSSLLQEHQFKIGLYSSPHYVDYRERIKIDNVLIPEEKVIQYVAEYRDLIASGDYSFFEWSFAFALLYFKESKVDYAIIEVGMGGRLDSTNIISPLVCGITNVQKDHTQYLGEHLEDIAKEKAGIVKPEVPVVIGEKQKHSLACFKSRAKDKKAPLVYADQLIEVVDFVGGEWVEFAVQGETFRTQFDLFGDFQLKNLKMALAMYRIFCLEEDLLMMDRDAFEKALSAIGNRTRMLGRMQVISRSPWIVLDSAHNLQGFEEMMKAINAFDFQRLFVVLGMVKEKDHREILSVLPKSAVVICSNINVPRSEDSEVLNEILDDIVQSHWIENSISEAYESALRSAGKEDLVLICGSVFAVGEWLDQQKPSKTN